MKKVIIKISLLLCLFGLTANPTLAKKTDTEPTPVVSINLPARKLTLYHDGVVVKRYPIAVSGMGYVAPLGKRIITRIVWNPWWYPPTNREWAKNETVMPPGPNNPMGPVKMDIGSRYYIHGTNEEWTVGRPVTHGCVRMRNADAKEVAYWLQLNFSSHFKDESFQRDMKAGKDNLEVAIDQPVPVQVIYDTVEIRDGMLYVYSDIYVHKEERLGLIQKEIERAGYDASKLRIKTLKWILAKAAGNDVRIDLGQILTSTKQKEKSELKKEDKAKKAKDKKDKKDKKD